MLLGLQVPRISFMDVFIFPTTTVEMLHSEHEAHIQALETTIEGSHHIQSLDCNNRFSLDLHVHLKGDEDMCAIPLLKLALAYTADLSSMLTTLRADITRSILKFCTFSVVPDMPCLSRAALRGDRS